MRRKELKFSKNCYAILAPHRENFPITKNSSIRKHGLYPDGTIPVLCIFSNSVIRKCLAEYYTLHPVFLLFSLFVTCVHFIRLRHFLTETMAINSFAIVGLLFHPSLYTNNSLDSSDTSRGRLLLYYFKRNKFAGIFCMWAAANFFGVS